MYRCLCPIICTTFLFWLLLFFSGFWVITVHLFLKSLKLALIILQKWFMKTHVKFWSPYHISKLFRNRCQVNK